MTGSQHLLSTAVRGQHRCFWLRGLLPAFSNGETRFNKTVVVEFIENEAVGCANFDCDTMRLKLPFLGLLVHEGQPGVPSRVVAATDGSGGESSDPRYRSCGWGVCWVRAGRIPEVLIGLSGSLPYTQQTVPLAELYALPQAVKNSPVCEQLVVYVDASYVVDNFNKGRAHCVGRVSHAWLWAAVFEVCGARTGEVLVLKVKAHNEAHVCKAIELQTFANIVADGLADFGSTLNCVKANAVAVELEALDRTAGLVITRLAKIGLAVARILDKRNRAAKAEKSGPADEPHGLSFQASGLVGLAGRVVQTDLPVYGSVAFGSGTRADPPLQEPVPFVERASSSTGCPLYVEPLPPALGFFEGEAGPVDRTRDPYLEDPPSLGHGPGTVDGGQQPAASGVAVADERHFVGYSDCGNDRALWARRVAVQRLVGGGHGFVPSELDRSFADKTVGLRCHRCLCDFPASRLVSLSKLDSPCTGDLFALKPGPVERPQSRDPSLVGTGMRLKNFELDSSH